MRWICWRTFMHGTKLFAGRVREAHVCEEHRDIVAASLIEVCVDETEERAWFL
jgi:hypothetical protein